MIWCTQTFRQLTAAFDTFGEDMEPNTCCAMKRYAHTQMSSIYTVVSNLSKLKDKLDVQISHTHIDPTIRLCKASCYTWVNAFTSSFVLYIEKLMSHIRQQTLKAYILFPLVASYKISAFPSASDILMDGLNCCSNSTANFFPAP